MQHDLVTWTMSIHLNQGRLVSALCFAVAGVVVGLAGRAVFNALRRHAQHTSWAWDDLAFQVLRDLSLPLATWAGLWLAILQLRLSADTRRLLGHVLLAALILAVTLAFAALAGGAVRSITLARSAVAGSASIFVNIARALVIGVGTLVLLQGVGISITPLLTALGVGGLAVALAMQDTLANLFAGVHILVSRKVQPGDYVQLDSGENGYIVDINWRNTAVRQLAGNIIIVPNARFADAIVTNFHRPEQDLSVLVEVGVSYDSDLEHVERVTVEVGRETMASVQEAVPDHKPFVRYHTFADSSINFSVILRAREYSGQYLVTHEFIKRLHARYRAESIEIPFPIRTLVMPRTSGYVDSGAPSPRSSPHETADHARRGLA